LKVIAILSRITSLFLPNQSDLMK